MGINANLNKIRAKLNNSLIMLIVKADGYGQGAGVIAKYSTADCLGVATVNEAVEVRQYEKTKPILILSYENTYSNAIKVVNNDLIPAVSNIETVLLLEEVAIKTNTKVKIHFSINSGMNRLGIDSPSDLADICKHIKKLIPIGIFSHYYSNNLTCIANQKDRFQQFIEIANAYFPNLLMHISSSGSYLTGGAYDMVRIGISAYGVGNEMENVLYMTSSIIAIHHLNKGDVVSYNAEYVAKTKMKIAVVLGGYADGISLKLSGKNIYINNIPYKIIGRICMDTFLIDITDSDVALGDTVEIIGDNISLEDRAKESETIVYDFLISLGRRVEHIYFVEK